jgi:NTE family protein
MAAGYRPPERDNAAMRPHGASAFEPPDVLVLGGGGILGEAWMTAVLAGLEEASGFDPRGCEAYVGTSAGSIVAARLAAGVPTAERLREAASPNGSGGERGEVGRPDVRSRVVRALEVGLAAGGTAVAPLVAVGLRSTAPAGALVRRAALARAPVGRRSLTELRRHVDGLGAAWDGRLAIAAVELETGRRVMLGQPGAPEASVGTAVEASCAIPGVFRPVEVGGRRLVDGGVWSPTNADRAPARRGTRVLCLNPTGSMRPSRDSPFGALGVVSRTIAAVEALALERRGAHVTVVAPDASSHAAIGPNLMDARPHERVVAAGLAQGRALAG